MDFSPAEQQLRQAITRQEHAYKLFENAKLVMKEAFLI